MSYRIIIGFVLLALPFSAGAYSVPEIEYWRAYELSLINASREEHGLPPVGLDDEISEMSQAHAADTAVHFDTLSEQSRRKTYLGHDSSDGKSFPSRVTEFGIDGLRAAGENVGFRYRGPIEDIHELIKESLDLIHNGMMAEVPPDDGHRVTILGDYTHVGVGLEFHKDISSEINTIFMVTDFGKFHEGRVVRIPELWNPPSPLYRADLLGSTEEQSRAPSPSKKSTNTSWAERNTLRVASKKSARLARLMEQVNRRKQIRLERLKR